MSGRETSNVISEELPVVSTLFTAQDVRDYLEDEEELDNAIEWCRETSVCRVFLETYRGTYYAERESLIQAREAFTAEGIDVSGCVTPTRVGKSSVGWDPISCFTNEDTQEELEEIFRYTASIFDEIMVDDFLFTDCTCEECITARGDESWAAYRSELMVELSRRCILEPARDVNPNASVIIKYPQWYDRFAERGYVVDTQTEDFDLIWVGTETRDYEDPDWGGTPQFGAYYLMRWLDEIGGEKTGGGWFDPYGTTEDTYLEQATQTILGGADEMVLFCYGSLLESTGPANVERFRSELPHLRELARLISGHQPHGATIPKPPNSDPVAEATIERFIGMLGIPLVPTVTATPEDDAVVLTPASLASPGCSERIADLIDANTPVLLTEGLAARLTDQTLLEDSLVDVLPVEEDPEDLLELEDATVDPIRSHLLEPLGISMDAPVGVGVYLFEGEEAPVVLENFNDESAEVAVRMDRSLSPVLTIPGESDVVVSDRDSGLEIELPGRSLIAFS